MNANVHFRPTTIDSRRIPEGEEQLDVLPRHFGKYMLRVEDFIFLMMRQVCGEYTLGVFDFHELSNGGLYLAPRAQRVRVRIHGNGFDEHLSGEAAGVVASYFAYRSLGAQNDGPLFRSHCESLLAFAQEHTEGERILAAVA